MKIEEFKIRKNGAQITIAGQKVFFSLDTLVRYNINSDSKLPEQKWQEILEYNEQVLAKEYLFGLLARYRKSKAEAMRKLRERGYSPSAAKAALAIACEYRYLDDELYAKDYVREKQQKAGIYKIKHDLLKKGIKKEHIEYALAEINEEVQLQAACKICTKTAKGEQKSYKLKQKIYSRLMQSGFSSNIIGQALKSYDIGEYGDNIEYD